MALGTINDPLILADAVTTSRVKPGHTVWLRGGVYDAQLSLNCKLQGTAESPIIVRNYPGEIAKIDAELILSCPYTRWMSEDYGLWIIGTATNRYSEQEGSTPTDLDGHGGVRFKANGVELINVRIINVNNAGILWFDYPGLIYGCHIIHNGWIAPDRHHGPGIYTTNDTGTDKNIENTVIVNSFRYGLQVFSAAEERIWDYNVVDCVLVGVDALLGGTYAAYPSMDNVIVTRLMMYGGYPLLGHYLVNRGDYVMLQNSIVHHTSAYSAKNLDDMRVENCKFLNSDVTLVDCTPITSSNEFGPFTDVDYNLVPNVYAPAFATLTVFAWESPQSVNINISTWAANGDSVRIHNIIQMHAEYQDVMVSDGAITVPMTGWTTPPPLGLDAVLTDAYPGDFGCWILQKL